MKRFLSAAGLCVFLLLFGLFVFLPTSEAENNTLVNLLNLPAPPPPNPLVNNNARRRSEDFFDKLKPPKDDAALEDLLDYWKHQNQYDAKYTYAPKPSEEALKRILAEIDKDPEKLTDFINVLPKDEDTAQLVKRFYDQELASRNYEPEWRANVKRWLTYNSSYFSEELLKDARQAGDADDYVTNQNEVLALARVDWEKARPILERLLNAPNQPVSQTLARWAFYQHALKEGNTSDIEKYRRELQATVENRGEGAGSRDLAMDALVESGDFEGRDEWYYSLLGDETLYELRIGGQVYTGLTTILNHSPTDKYVVKMLELVKSDNKAVRNAAVRNLSTLLSEKNPEVIKALLPWLENPQWAKEVANERRILIDSLTTVELPESVPGLIAVLNEKDTREVNLPTYASNSSYSANRTYSANTTVTPRSVDVYPYRYTAINALAVQKDARAVPALRLILPQVEPYEMRLVVRALLLCGGYSVSEQVEAVEFIAKAINQQQQNEQNAANTVMSNAAVTMSNTAVIATNTSVTNSTYLRPMTIINQSDIKIILGMQMMEQTEPSDELVTALLDRIEYLDKKEPDVAANLRKIIQNWRGAAVNSMLLRDLKNNKGDVDAVVKLLSLRRELKEKQSGEVYDIRGGGSLALGIAACLIDEPTDYDAILANENADSKIAMLGCARLIRARLPVREVAKNLQSPNKMLALATERYLESEDSPEARSLVLAVHPNEAVILGARNSFAAGAAPVFNNNFLRDLFVSVDESFAALPPYYFNAEFTEFTSGEKKLQKEVRENQELLGIYSYDNNFIRIYREKAVFSWEEGFARYRERVLSQAEFDAFKSYLAANRVDELPPFLTECSGCEAKQLVMLSRHGGRRIFVRGDETPKFFAELEKNFDELRKPPAKLHYWLEKNIAGLEVLFADDNLQARAVWKNGDDFRVLIDNRARREQIDAELEKQEEAIEESEEVDETNYQKAAQQLEERRRQRKYENFSWYRFDPLAKLSGVIAQPDGLEIIPAPDDSSVAAEASQWKARTANFEIRADNEGLYKVVRGRATKIRSGIYYKPLVTPNGRWAIVTKYSDEQPPALFRVNLLTGREFKIPIEQYPTYEAIAFIAPLNKILVFGGSVGREEYSEEETKAVRYGDYFLLSVETGAVQPAKGETRPLVQQTFRQLQPTAKPDEFWAAIPGVEKNETQVGVYDAKTLAFKSLIKLPQIAFDSMNMWIDEKESKIYFVYEGHLLVLPLPKGN
jgi:hypothetical protein